MKNRIFANRCYASFDDVRSAAYMERPLTTVRQPKGEMGNIAVEIVLRMIRDKDRGLVQDIILKSELVIRQTTKGI